MLVPVGYPYLDCSHGYPRAMVPMKNPYVDQPQRSKSDGAPDLDCSHGDPRAMVPMGNPFHHRLWLGSTGETHVESHKGNPTMILHGKSARQHTSVTREWSNWKECRSYLRFQPRKSKFSNGKEATAEITLKKQKELKEQRTECSQFECSL